jgi:predicted GH43/DUF377 family glycosyl hydrolase
MIKIFALALMGCLGAVSARACDVSGPLTRSTTPMLANSNIAGSYDQVRVGDKAVIKMGPCDYRMWFEGVDAANTSRVGYATSTDGVDWVKSGVVVMVPDKPWEGTAVAALSVLYENGLFKMWYHAGADQKLSIGYAESLDGLAWTKYANNPVLIKTLPWEGNGVFEPHVFNMATLGLGTGYRMYYTGSLDDAGNWWGDRSMGLATSHDGISWTKYSTKPVIPFNSLTSYSSWGGITWGNGLWRIWYSMVDQTAGLSYASSVDGINFINGTHNPVLVKPNDPTSPEADMVGGTVTSYLDDNQYKIMYDCFNWDYKGARFDGICLATVNGP